MSLETEYLTALMLRTLEQETGSKEKSWKALIKAQQAQVDKAPKEIQHLLQEKFETLIVERFSGITKH